MVSGNVVLKRIEIKWARVEMFQLKAKMLHENGYVNTSIFF
jgi:hypothetical protein